MLPLMATVLAADVWFFCSTDNLLTFNGSANAYMVVGLLVFMVVSSLFHELGHASACKHFGIRHGGIGFGLSLNFPVLYTDVTEVWRLRRADRCIVTWRECTSRCTSCWRCWRCFMSLEAIRCAT